MKLGTLKFYGVLMLLASVVTMNSCKKEVITPKDITPTDPSSSLNSATEVFQEVMQIIDAAASGHKSNKRSSILSCATITLDTSSLPYHAIVDFGTGCIDDDGTFHSGRVEADYLNKDLKFTGNVVNATLIDFTSDDDVYNGTLDITTVGPNGSGNIVWHMNSNYTKVVTSTSTTTETQANADYEWTNPTDERAILSITGNIDGKNSSGRNFVGTILDPLILNTNSGCKEFYTKGQIKIEVSGNPDEYLDYGDGTCDDLATQTINGNSQTIHLQN